jgi:hypothetical protein
MRRFRALPALALATLTLTACPVNPATGERQLMLISEAQEIEMGRQGAQQVEVSLGLYDNPDLQEYVSQVGLDLAANSEKPDLPWSFKIVDDLVVNAFALRRNWPGYWGTRSAMSPHATQPSRSVAPRRPSWASESDTYSCLRSPLTAT